MQEPSQREAVIWRLALASVPQQWLNDTGIDGRQLFQKHGLLWPSGALDPAAAEQASPLMTAKSMAATAQLSGLLSAPTL